MEKEARGEAWDCWPAFLLSPVWRLPGLKVQQVPALVQDGTQLHHRFRLPFLRLPSLRRQKFLPLHWEGDYESNTRMESMGGLLPFVHEFSLKSSKNRKPFQIFFTVYWLTASSFHCILFHSPYTSQPHFTAFCTKGKLNTSWLLTRMEHSDILEQQAQLEVFQKGMHQMSQSCYKRFNSFHVDLNKQN